MTAEISKAIFDAMQFAPFDSMDIVERSYAAKQLATASSMQALETLLAGYRDGKRPGGFPPDVSKVEPSNLNAGGDLA